MQPKIRLLFFVFSLAIAVSAPFVIQQTPAYAQCEPTIAHGDFEVPFVNGLCPGWTKWSDGRDNPSWQCGVEVSNDAVSGSQSQQIVLGGSSSEAYGGIFYRVECLQALELYTVSFKIKLFDVEKSTRVFMGVNYLANTDFDPGESDWEMERQIGVCSSEAGDISEWTQFSRTFMAGTESSAHTIWIFGWRKFPATNAAYFRIDDISIQHIPPHFSYQTGPAVQVSEPTALGQNLLTNSDFESGFSGSQPNEVANGWTSWRAQGTGFFRQSPNLGKFGSGTYGGANFQNGQSYATMNSKVHLRCDPNLGFDIKNTPGQEDCIIIGRTIVIDDVWDYFQQNGYPVGEGTTVFNSSDDYVIQMGRWHAEISANKQQQYPHIDAWQGLNESWCQTRETARKTALFDAAFAQRCSELGIKSAVLAIAVGNPIRDEIIDIMKDAYQLGDYVVSHAYGGNPEYPGYSGLMIIGNDHPEGNSLKMRYVQDYCRNQGYRCAPAIYGEVGTYYGWHSAGGYSVDFPFTSTQVAQDYVAVTAQYDLDPWCVGGCVFVTGGTGIWQTWDIAPYPDIISAIGNHNSQNPADSRGGEAQQFGQRGESFDGGICQAVSVVPGNKYNIRGDIKFEAKRGGNPLSPDAEFYIGVDQTGQTSNGAAATIAWSGDQITPRRLNSDTWYRISHTFQASGSNVSIWLRARQTVSDPGDPHLIVSVDNIQVLQTDGVVPPTNTPAPTNTPGSAPTNTPTPSGGCGGGQNLGFEITTLSGVYGDGNHGKHAPDHWCVGAEDHNQFFPSNAFSRSGSNCMLKRENDNGSTANSWYYTDMTVTPGNAYQASIYWNNVHGEPSHSLGIWVGLYQGGNPGNINNYTRTLIDTQGQAAWTWHQIVSPNVTASGSLMYLAFGILDDNGTYSGADKMALDDVAITLVSSQPTNTPPPVNTPSPSNTPSGSCSYIQISNAGFEDGNQGWSSSGSSGTSSTVHAHSGSRSWGWSQSYSGGGTTEEVYQMVNATVGAEYQLSAYAYRYQQGGADWDVGIRLLVDPNGGTNFSVEGNWVSAVGSWGLLTANFTAASSQVTIGARLVQNHSLQLNEVFVDDFDCSSLSCPTAGPTNTPVPPTPTPESSTIAEDFDAMPTWSSSFDAGWGSSAIWSIVGGGQSGNYLKASRGSSGSSCKALVYNVSSNTTYTVSGYMRCPNYSGGYWAEFACKLGSQTAENFDGDGGSWTMIQKFDSYGGNPNGNGDTWTYYSVQINTGSNTQISVGFKLGSSGGGGPDVGWDTLRIEESQPLGLVPQMDRNRYGLISEECYPSGA